MIDLTDQPTDLEPSPAGQVNFIADPERETINVPESTIKFSCPARLAVEL
jgi:hypothetical protein